MCAWLVVSDIYAYSLFNLVICHYFFHKMWLLLLFFVSDQI